MKEIKTHAELLELDGRTIDFRSSYATYAKCELLVEGDYVYILSNYPELFGITVRNKRGFNYSFLISDSSDLFEELTTRSILLHPLVEDKYYYANVKPKNPNPEWFTGKPMYVYYSDVSEEEAKASKRVGLLVSVECYKETNVYPYRVATCCENVNDDYPNSDSSYTYTSNFTYVVPIERVAQEKQNEIDSIKEELTKLNERLSKLGE